MISITQPPTASRDGLCHLPRYVGSKRRPGWKATVVAAMLSGPLGCALAAPPGSPAVQRRLEQTMVSVEFDDVSLGKVIQQLRAEHKLNIYVNERALARQDIDLSTPVTLRLNHVPLATALRLLLRGASQEGAAPLTYVVEDEVVVISTADDTSALPVLRTYDVSDLLQSGFAQRRMMNTPLLRLQLTGAEGSGTGGGSATQNPFQGGGGGGWDEASTTLERLHALIELIREAVAPETWRVAGGSDGSILRQGNKLVVRTSPLVHKELENLLALLRSELPRTIDLHLSLIRLSPNEMKALREQLAQDWPRLPSAEASKLEAEFSGDGAVLLRMTTTGFSGQSQFVSSLKQQDYVAWLQPVVDQDAEAYQPQIGQANSGIELIVLPVLSPGGEGIMLDVSMAWAQPGTLDARLFKAGPEELSVQLRSAGMRTLVSKVHMNVGQAILLTVPPGEVLEEEPAEAMVLLIRPSVH